MENLDWKGDCRIVGIERPVRGPSFNIPSGAVPKPKLTKVYCRDDSQFLVVCSSDITFALSTS